MYHLSAGERLSQDRLMWVRHIFTTYGVVT